MNYDKNHIWYMWKRGKDQLIIGDDIAKTQKDYFLGDRKPDTQMTEQELDDCGRLVRVIDGKIFVGKTDEEKEEDRKRAEMMPFPQPKGLQLDEAVDGYKAKLAETDYVVIKIAEGVADRSEYEDVLAQRAEWRRRIEELEG